MGDITDASLVVPEPRRRGRPRVTMEKVVVSTYVPREQYVRLMRIAASRDQSLSKVLSSVLDRALPPR